MAFSPVCSAGRMEGIQHTTRPIVTGQSVLALRYRDGVMMAADTQLCYGNQQKFKNVQRLFPLHQSKALLGFSGEYSDVQYILKLITDIETQDFVCETPSKPRTAPEIQGYLTRVLYAKRCRFDPLWNQIVIGGFRDDQTPFLGYVDYHGTTYEDDFVTTGFGSYFAIPLLREKASPDMSEQDARRLLEECMRILFARDCLGYNRIRMATVTADGVTVDEPYSIHPQWGLKAFTKPALDVDLCASTW